ncbi:hypothetical protein VPHD148_0017 [Vibrio phage D148]
MANQLKITSYYENASWVIEAEVNADSDTDFPRDIFLWTLDRDGALSEFKSIGQVDQVARYPLYDSNRTSNFGIHLVRYGSSRQEVSTEQDRDNCVTVLKAAFDILVDGFETQSEPVEELYPPSL